MPIMKPSFFYREVNYMPNCKEEIQDHAYHCKSFVFFIFEA